MNGENNRATLAVTLTDGDSVVMTGQDHTEVKIKGTKGRYVRVAITAEKSVRISRRMKKDEGVKYGEEV